MRWVSRDEVAAIQVPALVISGEGDKITKAEWAQVRGGDRRSPPLLMSQPGSIRRLLWIIWRELMIARARRSWSPQAVADALPRGGEVHILRDASHQARTTVAPPVAGACLLSRSPAGVAALHFIIRKTDEHPAGIQQVMLEKPETVNALIEEYVKRMLSSPAS